MRDIVFSCDYDVFEYIRDQILHSVSHGLISSTYTQGIAYFKFWDSQYIPERLRVFSSNDQRDQLPKLEKIGTDVIEKKVCFIS